MRLLATVGATKTWKTARGQPVRPFCLPVLGHSRGIAEPLEANLARRVHDLGRVPDFGGLSDDYDRKRPSSERSPGSWRSNSNDPTILWGACPTYTLLRLNNQVREAPGATSREQDHHRRSARAPTHAAVARRSRRPQSAAAPAHVARAATHTARAPTHVRPRTSHARPRTPHGRQRTCARARCTPAARYTLPRRTRALSPTRSATRRLALSMPI